MGGRIKPYLVRNMIRTNLHGKTGICSVIQKMYLGTNNVNVQYKLRIAMRQAKELDKALRECKAAHEARTKPPTEPVE